MHCKRNFSKKDTDMLRVFKRKPLQNANDTKQIERIGTGIWLPVPVPKRADLETSCFLKKNSA
jgi:hypothetical protein